MAAAAEMGAAVAAAVVAIDPAAPWGKPAGRHGAAARATESTHPLPGADPVPTLRSAPWRHVTLAVVLGLSTLAASAALKPGSPAPDFSADAAVGGEPFRFSLAEALKRGPVVLYFYPKAFTSGCTVEAHQFAEATDRFKALGATVIGMSNDDIATLKRFSVEACRSKFAVAADAGGQVMRRYDAAMEGTDFANRISYAISPEGKVLHTHSSPNPDGHVQAMLQAVEKWRAARR